MTLKTDKTTPVEYWVGTCYIPTHTEVWFSYNYNDLFYEANHPQNDNDETK